MCRPRRSQTIGLRSVRVSLQECRSLQIRAECLDQAGGDPADEGGGGGCLPLAVFNVGRKHEGARMDQVPEELLARASQSVTAWLVPNEMAALRRESRAGRGLPPSRLARDLIVSSLQSKGKERRRGTSLGGGEGPKRSKRSEAPFAAV